MDLQVIEIMRFIGREAVLWACWRIRVKPGMFQKGIVFFLLGDFSNRVFHCGTENNEKNGAAFASENWWALKAYRRSATLQSEAGIAGSVKENVECGMQFHGLSDMQARLPGI